MTPEPREAAEPPSPQPPEGPPEAAPAPAHAAKLAVPHALPSTSTPSPFPPIEDFAFLSNCHTGALVAPDGSVGWLCVPRFDSPSLFGTLLGVFLMGLIFVVQLSFGWIEITGTFEGGSADFLPGFLPATHTPAR